MAKKARKAAPPKEKASKGKKAFPLIARGDLSKLLEQANIYQNRSSTAQGSLREMIGEAVKKKHLHSGAFSLINRLWRMGGRDPQALWLMLAHFDDMREKCGLDRIAKAQGQLLPAINEDEGEEAPKAENVVDYPQPREVEERAGDAA